jgi:hypothetical protein
MYKGTQQLKLKMYDKVIKKKKRNEAGKKLRAGLLRVRNDDCRIIKRMRIINSSHKRGNDGSLITSVPVEA